MLPSPPLPAPPTGSQPAVAIPEPPPPRRTALWVGVVVAFVLVAALAGVVVHEAGGRGTAAASATTSLPASPTPPPSPSPQPVPAGFHLEASDRLPPGAAFSWYTWRASDGSFRIVGPAPGTMDWRSGHTWDTVHESDPIQTVLYVTDLPAPLDRDATRGTLMNWMATADGVARPFVLVHAGAATGWRVDLASHSRLTRMEIVTSGTRMYSLFASCARNNAPQRRMLDVFSASLVVG
ncbi:MAG: hypothetical protein ACM3OO_09655 [Planctomycetaceae bacterium]